MGRRANYDVKEKRGPGRKTRKQGEVTMKLFETKNFKPEKVSPNVNNTLKRFAFVLFFAFEALI